MTVNNVIMGDFSSGGPGGHSSKTDSTECISTLYQDVKNAISFTNPQNTTQLSKYRYQ